MGSVVSAITGGGQGSDFQAKGAELMKPVNQGQLDTGYNQANEALRRQEAFVAALQGINAIGNQQTVFDQQQALANQLQGVANGTGPNPALMQLNNTTGQNIANQAALMASQRGAGANAGLLARQAAMQGGALQQQAAGQGAQLQAQQQLAAMNALQGQQQAMGQVAGQQVGQQLQGTQGLAQTTGNQYGQLLGGVNAFNSAKVADQQGMNSANQSMAQGNAGRQQDLFMGAAKGVGSAFAMSHGGQVPGHAQMEGDHPKNDTVPAMLSPGEVVIPKSVMESPDPANAAAHFVSGVVAHKKSIIPNAHHAKGTSDHLNCGGMVKGYAEGGEVSSGKWWEKIPELNKDRLEPKMTLTPEAQGEDIYQRSLAQQPPWMNQSINEKNALSQAVGRQEQSAIRQDNALFAKEQENAQKMSAIDQMNAQRAKLGMPPVPGGTPISQPQAPNQFEGAMGIAPEGAPQVNQDPYGIGAQQSAYMSGLGKQMKGAQNEAWAQGQLGKEEAALSNKATQDLQAQKAAFDQKAQVVLDDRKKIEQAIQDGKIDPNKYLNSMSTGSKIGTAIGLILGGVGAGASGENPVLKHMQLMIDKDIDAQKANLGKQNTLLDANFKTYGNMRDAYDMTRVQTMDILKNQLMAAASKASGPLAQARAQQAIGAIEKESAAIQGNMAMRANLLQGNGSGQVDPVMKIKGLVDPSQQEKYYKELDEAKKAMKVQQNALQVFDKVAKLNTVGNLLNPQAHSKIKAALGPVIASLSKETAGRFTEQDAKLLEDAFSKAIDSKATIGEKRQMLNKILTEKMNFSLLDSIGANPLKQAGGMGVQFVPGAKK